MSTALLGALPARTVVLSSAEGFAVGLLVLELEFPLLADVLLEEFEELEVLINNKYHQ